MGDIDYSLYYDKPIPDETDLEFSRFLIYRDLPPSERTVKNAVAYINAQGDGVSQNTVQTVAARNKWRKRALAFDAYKSGLQMQVMEADLMEVVDYTYQQEDLELLTATRLLQKKLSDLNTRMDSKDPENIPDVMDIQRAIKTMETLQTLRRRRAGLPTNFVSKDADNENYDEIVFTIGGDK